MKSLCSIERIAIIRWVTIAYLGALVLPLLFLRYGNTIAVAQSALLIMLPIATAGLALSHAKVPASYVSFSIHDKVLLRFIAKSLLLAQVVNLCLSLLYVSIIGELVNERLSSHTALVLVFLFGCANSGLFCASALDYFISFMDCYHLFCGGRSSD